ncbi:MAG TPA: glutamate formiminotransferase, partial [Bacteroidota bacterium]|nr:glutamate formiminotransferase [Bacteroidota bacterium]
KVPGTLQAVKAMGVSLERFDIAQVSINLTNYHVTPPHVAFEEVRKEAQKLGINVTGSEIVGLIPKEAMLLVGKFYSDNANATEDQLIEKAIESLRLSQLEPFDPKKKIIEYLI